MSCPPVTSRLIRVKSKVFTVPPGPFMIWLFAYLIFLLGLILFFSLPFHLLFTLKFSHTSLLSSHSLQIFSQLSPSLQRGLPYLKQTSEHSLLCITLNLPLPYLVLLCSPYHHLTYCVFIVYFPH